MVSSRVQGLGSGWGWGGLALSDPLLCVAATSPQATEASPSLNNSGSRYGLFFPPRCWDGAGMGRAGETKEERVSPG
jgi:hypothetical protein